jgi:glycosyltransferase involved in cell wall biosynthesis
MNTQENPLISFIILTYNQEKYIKEAIEGAFNQTYSPLEIIISDDCSTDNTYEIIKKSVASYSGPHIIKLNRNENNLGIGGQMNRIIELTSGELIIASSGDDISIPIRTERIYIEWIKNKETTYSIYSNLIKIDEFGVQQGKWNNSGIEQHSKTLDEVIERKIVWLYGCSHAFSRQVFLKFGRIDDNLLHEDEVIPFRSLILGKILYIDEPLILYRRHTNNIWNVGNEIAYKEFRINAKKMHYDKLRCINNWIRDLNTAVSKNLIDETKSQEYIEKLMSYQQNELKLDLYFSTNHPLRTIWRVFWFQITFHKLKKKAIYSWLQNSLPPLWYSKIMGKLVKMKLIKRKYYT